jgi:hypothetical protein
MFRGIAAAEGNQSQKRKNEIISKLLIRCAKDGFETKFLVRGGSDSCCCTFAPSPLGCLVAFVSGWGALLCGTESIGVHHHQAPHPLRQGRVRDQVSSSGVGPFAFCMQHQVTWCAIISGYWPACLTRHLPISCDLHLQRHTSDGGLVFLFRWQRWRAKCVSGCRRRPCWCRWPRPPSAPRLPPSPQAMMR